MILAVAQHLYVAIPAAVAVTLGLYALADTLERRSKR